MGDQYVFRPAKLPVPSWLLHWSFPINLAHNFPILSVPLQTVERLAGNLWLLSTPPTSDLDLSGRNGNTRLKRCSVMSLQQYFAPEICGTAGIEPEAPGWKLEVIKSEALNGVRELNSACNSVDRNIL